MIIGSILGSPPIIVSVYLRFYKNGSWYPNNNYLGLLYCVNPPNPTSIVINLIKFFNKVIFFQ
jgi:hypothetical protein